MNRKVQFVEHRMASSRNNFAFIASLLLHLFISKLFGGGGCVVI